MRETDIEPKVKCAFHSAWSVWGWPECSDPSTLQLHHVLNKSKLAGKEEALHLVEGKYSKYFMRWVCSKHNRDRYADTRYARAFLIKQWGRETMEPILEVLRFFYKDGYPDLSYDALVEVG